MQPINLIPLLDIPRVDGLSRRNFRDSDRKIRARNIVASRGERAAPPEEEYVSTEKILRPQKHVVACGALSMRGRADGNNDGISLTCATPLSYSLAK